MSFKKEEKTKSVRLQQRESTLLRLIGDMFINLQTHIKELYKVFPNKIDLSPDGSLAKIYLFSDEGEEFVRKIIGDLVVYKPSMKKAIATHISLRVIPNILFVFDKQYEKEQKLQNFIDKVIDKDKESGQY